MKINKNIKRVVLCSTVASLALFANLVTWANGVYDLELRVKDTNTSNKNWVEAKNRLNEKKTFKGFLTAAVDFNKDIKLANDIRSETFRETGSYSR